jgi:adenosylcobinamide-GDP ribazoletransferase
VALTGGLHLDGASDTADGLAVTDRERRLTVMQDSTTGAFGAMAIAVILLLKTLALAELRDYRWFCLILAAGWSRWGQVAAIAFYPYLKPTGKGARQRQNFQFPQDLLLGVSILLAYSGFFSYQHPQQSLVILGMTFGAAAIALLSGWWFARQLGGHTGDSYGAIVEWSEAFILCLLTLGFH